MVPMVFKKIEISYNHLKLYIILIFRAYVTRQSQKDFLSAIFSDCKFTILLKSVSNP